ncbi:MAG: hypothetical protein FWD15_03070 [Alphaproteobacteria bacterium]|nr:hypothetical protein [Alphaproteobacteria bacterium]
MIKAIFCIAFLFAGFDASASSSMKAPAVSGKFLADRSMNELLDNTRSMGSFTAIDDGRIFWRVERPARVVYVKTKTEMCQDYGTGPTPTKRSRMLERLSLVFKALLSDDFDVLEDYFEITRVHEGDAWRVHMSRTPEDNPWLIKRIEAAGDGAEIRTLEITGYFDDKVFVEFSNITPEAIHEITCVPPKEY